MLGGICGLADAAPCQVSGSPDGRIGLPFLACRQYRPRWAGYYGFFEWNLGVASGVSSFEE
jgi:hypothetical protein